MIIQRNLSDYPFPRIFFNIPTTSISKQTRTKIEEMHFFFPSPRDIRNTILRSFSSLFVHTRQEAYRMLFSHCPRRIIFSRSESKPRPEILVFAIRYDEITREPQQCCFNDRNSCIPSDLVCIKGSYSG